MLRSLANFNMHIINTIFGAIWPSLKIAIRKRGICFARFGNMFIKPGKLLTLHAFIANTN